MADGDLTLKLDEDTRKRLNQAADAAGVSMEDYVLGVIAEDLELEPLAVSRQRLADYDRTGDYITLEEAMAHFDSELEARLARKE